MTFNAFQIQKSGDAFHRHVVQRNDSDLPEGDVLVEVQYSSLNFKDAMSANGNPGVTRNFPHTPGIDAAGTVLRSSASGIREGSQVIVIGFDLGMGTAGGYGQHISVPAGWVTPMPDGLDPRSAMILGTAGFTAALCVHKLEAAGVAPGNGPVLVTGASGGVGTVAIKLLNHLGFEVTAVTGKPEQHEFLRSLGATGFLTREEAAVGADRPLLKESYAGVVDSVGGDILFNALKSLKYGGSLAACGLAASPQFAATVLPFILRNVNLLGVDSVQLPIDQKNTIWKKLAGPWRMDLELLVEALTLDTLSDAIDRIFAGRMVGRGLVDLSG